MAVNEGAQKARVRLFAAGLNVKAVAGGACGPEGLGYKNPVSSRVGISVGPSGHQPHYVQNWAAA